MKFAKDLLFAQYYELKKNGRPVKSAKNTGILLISVLAIMISVLIAMLLGKFNLFDGLGNIGISGRGLGKIIGLAMLGLIFGIVYLIFGNQEKYDKIIQEYEKMPMENQEMVLKNGTKKFFLILAVLLVVVFIVAITG